MKSKRFQQKLSCGASIQGYDCDRAGVKTRYSLLHLATYWLGPVQMAICHVGALIPLWTGLSLGSTVWIALLYAVRMLATTAIYHRLLTHKAYRAPRLLLWIGSFIAASSGQMGPSWWKAHHQAHHLYADRKMDPHSPHFAKSSIMGLYRAQVGWLVSPSTIPACLPDDVERDQVMVFIDRFHFVPLVFLGAVSYRIGGFEYLGAFFLSTFLLFHGVATVNSLAHMCGGQPFSVGDKSRNNLFVASITLGEGWHNTHHAFPSSSRHGITVRSGQIFFLPDPTFMFIRALKTLGMVSGIRVPSSTQILAKAKQAV